MAKLVRTPQNPGEPFAAIATRLTEEDDPGLWQTALTVLTDDFLQRYDEVGKNREWLFVVGACSRWVRPHRAGWKTKAGRFAYPEGYNDGSPELDWSVVLVYRDQRWRRVERLSGKRRVIFRVAIPTRSSRHKQAAINTRWLPGDETVLYGFRRVNEHWKCVAASDQDDRGPVNSA